jgi:hypothetical protein
MWPFDRQETKSARRAHIVTHFFRKHLLQPADLWRLINITFIISSGLFGAENERKIVAHIKKGGNARFAPDRRTVRSITRRSAVLMFHTDSKTKKKWRGTTG